MIAVFINRKAALLCSVIACMAVLNGCRRSQEATAPADVEVQVITVDAKKSPNEIKVSGAIEAVDKADVAFLVAGRIESVDVEDGAEVKKGQVLARLDPADYQHSLEIAEARLAEVRARHSRLSKMHELGSLTDTDFDKIDAGVREAESATELTRRQLAYTELRAPFDGCVVKHGIAAGVVVAPGIPVFTVLSPDPVWANVSVAEVDARKIRVGQGATVTVPATGYQTAGGRVEALLPQADVLSRSFTAKIKVENRDHMLRPGNVIVARIQVGEEREAITVPPEVVQHFPDGSLFVWLVDPVRRIAVRQIIETGSLRTNEVEITAGLKAGDQVVLTVPHTLFEGTPLKVNLVK